MSSRFPQQWSSGQTSQRRHEVELTCPHLGPAVGSYLLPFPAAGKLVPKEEAKGIHWMTWTGVVGPEVNGIWVKYSNATNVNSVDANYSSAVLVAGDDLGLVKLFRFPCLKKGE